MHFWVSDPSSLDGVGRPFGRQSSADAMTTHINASDESGMCRKLLRNVRRRLYLLRQV